MHLVVVVISLIFALLIITVAITYSLFIFNTNPKRGGMNSHCNGEYAAFSTAYIAF